MRWEKTYFLFYKVMKKNTKVFSWRSSFPFWRMRLQQQQKLQKQNYIYFVMRRENFSDAILFSSSFFFSVNFSVFISKQTKTFFFVFSSLIPIIFLIFFSFCVIFVVRDNSHKKDNLMRNSNKKDIKDFFFWWLFCFHSFTRRKSINTKGNWSFFYFTL